MLTGVDRLGASSCNAGFDQYASDRLAGFAQCVDNLNPAARTRDDLSTSWQYYQAGCIQQGAHYLFHGLASGASLIAPGAGEEGAISRLALSSKTRLAAVRASGDAGSIGSRLSAEDLASTDATRARELQEALPTGSQGRVTTGVDVGRDSDGAVRTVTPDADGREQLLRLYGATSGFPDLDLTAALVDTDGLTATFLRELVRRAVIAAALARPNEDPVTVTAEDLAAATAQLKHSRSRLTRALLGDGEKAGEGGGFVRPGLHVMGMHTFRGSGGVVSGQVGDAQGTLGM